MDRKSELVIRFPIDNSIVSRPELASLRDRYTGPRTYEQLCNGFLNCCIFLYFRQLEPDAEFDFDSDACNIHVQLPGFRYDYFDGSAFDLIVSRDKHLHYVVRQFEFAMGPHGGADTIPVGL